MLSHAVHSFRGIARGRRGWAPSPCTQFLREKLTCPYFLRKKYTCRKSPETCRTTKEVLNRIGVPSQPEKCPHYSIAHLPSEILATPLRNKLGPFKRTRTHSHIRIEKAELPTKPFYSSIYRGSFLSILVPTS